MRKLILLATIGLVTALGLGACSNNEGPDSQAQVNTAPTRPTSLDDAAGWQKYLGHLVSQNLEGMTSSSPYPYLVPAGDDPQSMGQRQRQLGTVQGIVARTVLPGNLLAFGGPDSKTTADFVITAFKRAEPGSFDGVIVLFIGDAADKARVIEALKPSGATVRFVQM